MLKIKRLRDIVSEFNVTWMQAIGGKPPLLARGLRPRGPPGLRPGFPPYRASILTASGGITPEAVMSSSEKRDREYVVSVRLSAEENALLEERRADRGLTRSDYTRAILLESVPIGVAVRNRYPTAAEIDVGKILDAIHALTSALNSIGAHSNQIAHRANCGAAINSGEIADFVASLDAVKSEIAPVMDQCLAVFSVKKV